MIRRDDGDSWLLISQIAHAEIAAEIATVWQDDALHRPSFGRDLLLAIRHHDDGWAEWEQQPTVDPVTGKPRDFMEMETSVAVGIWTRSIERCRRMSSPAGLSVSRHFCYLAERATESRSKPATELAALQQFLEEQQHLQDRLVAESDDTLSDADIDTGFRWVQFFDRVSLWICSSRREAALTITTPTEVRIVMTAIDDATITVTPAVLSSCVELRISARCIPVGFYANERELRAELDAATSVPLKWSLRNETG